MIRSGCDRAEVSATFGIGALPDACAWLDAREIAHDGECIVRRVLVHDGRSRAFVNGSAVPITELSGLGERLLDIHGQHAHQSLTRRSYQRDLLDAYGGHREAATEVARAHRALRDTRERLDALRQAADTQAARTDLLRFQINELEEAHLAPGEWQELEAEHRRLSNAEALGGRCISAIDALAEDGGAEEQLYNAARIVEALTALDPALDESLKLLNSALIEIQEAIPNLRHYAETITVDPERFAAVDERMTRIHQLARKFP